MSIRGAGLVLGIKSQDTGMEIRKVREGRLGKRSTQHEVVWTKAMEGSDNKIGIRNRLINGGQRVSDGFGLLEIRINRLSALLEVKELKLESCSTGCRFLSKMTRQAIPDAFRSVKPNGKASYIFSEGCIEDAHNLLIYCNPIVMLQIRNSFDRSVSGCRSGDGDCWLRNSPINIPPEISTTEGCWRRRKEPLRKRKEEKTREHK